MKPQTGILSSAHSYSKQYVQFHVESECAVASHTGLRVKVPDIQQYTHSTVLRLLPWHRLACSLGCEGSLVPMKGRQNTQTVEASPRPLLQQSSRSLRR